jgi:hypothetical protein
LSISGNASVTAGELYILNLSAGDPGADTINGWVIDWGDGTVDTIVGNPSTADHVYLQPKALAGDFDGDGDVDGTDLVKFSDNLGKTGTGLAGDFDGDGDVDNDDMAVFVPNFGKIGYDVYTISATASDEDGTYIASNWQVDVRKAPAGSQVSVAETTAPVPEDVAEAAGEPAVPQTVPEAPEVGDAALHESAEEPATETQTVPPAEDGPAEVQVNRGAAQGQTPAFDTFRGPKPSTPDQADPATPGSEQPADETRPAQKRSNNRWSLWPQRSSSWNQFSGSRPDTGIRQGVSQVDAGWRNQFNTPAPHGAMVDLSGHFQDFRPSSKRFNDRSARPWIGRFVNDLATSDDEMNPNRRIKVELSRVNDKKDSAYRQDINSPRPQASGFDFLSRKKRP